MPAPSQADVPVIAKPPRRRTGIGTEQCVVLLLLLCLATGAFGSDARIANADDAATWHRQTLDGHYRVELRPADEPLSLTSPGKWRIELKDQSNRSVDAQQLVIMGGMPEHGHGLPTSPRVTRRLGAGSYEIDGVLFNMYGRWDVVVGVAGPAGPDKAEFRFVVEPVSSSGPAAGRWTAQELALMRSLAMPDERPRKNDASNEFLQNVEAIELGRDLFFDPGLSAGKDISCASCHDPTLHFTDGKPRSFGSHELQRNSPTLLGASHADWFYWDGRRDSLWAQALTPIETPGEMDSNRTSAVRYVMSSSAHGVRFARLVGTLPPADDLPDAAGPYAGSAEKAAWSRLNEPQRRVINRAFAAIGKIIAAYVATLEPEPSRFDRYVASVDARADDDTIMSDSERRGLRLFLDPQKTQCIRCHNGPYLTNFSFSNIGTGNSLDGSLPDFGRMIGLRAALVDEFNCIGRYSGVAPDKCRHHQFVAQGHADNGAFKVPTLRNVAETGPYMHDGRFADLRSVLEYYREPPPQETTNHELPPLDLTDNELRDLAAFLEALTSERPQVPP